MLNPAVSRGLAHRAQHLHFIAASLPACVLLLCPAWTQLLSRAAPALARSSAQSAAVPSLDPEPCTLSHLWQAWTSTGVEGVHRFLRRAHRLVTEAPVSSQPAPSEQLRLLHVTIKRVRAWYPPQHIPALHCTAVRGTQRDPAGSDTDDGGWQALGCEAAWRRLQEPVLRVPCRCRRG